MPDDTEQTLYNVTIAGIEALSRAGGGWNVFRLCPAHFEKHCAENADVVLVVDGGECSEC